MKAIEIVEYYKGWVEGDEYHRRPRLDKEEREKLLVMLGEMGVHREAGDTLSFVACFGFVQGTLWAKGCFSLEELKAHNRGIGKEFEEK